MACSESYEKDKPPLRIRSPLAPAVHFVVETEHVFILRIDRERLFVRSVAERRPVRGRYGERIRFFAEIVARDREVEPRDPAVRPEPSA